MLQISRDFGNIAAPPATADAGSQTDVDDQPTTTASVAVNDNDSTLYSSGLSSVLGVDGSLVADDNAEEEASSATATAAENDEDVLTNNSSCSKPSSHSSNSNASTTIVHSSTVSTATEANNHIINNNNTINIKCNQSAAGANQQQQLPEATKTMGNSVATVVTIDQAS